MKSLVDRLAFEPCVCPEVLSAGHADDHILLDSVLDEPPLQYERALEAGTRRASEHGVDAPARVGR